MFHLRIKPLEFFTLASVFFILGAVCTFFIMSAHVEMMVEKEHAKKLRSQIPITDMDYKPIYNKTLADDAPSWVTMRTNLQPFTLYFKDGSVSYQNGGKEHGQHIIDTTKDASTWGAAEVYDGNDGFNTHFIGHIGVQFFDIQNEEWITVTDSLGVPTHYYVTDTYITDDRGLEILTRENRIEAVLEKGHEEKITLQTCITDDLNWIVEAKKVP